jgi:hypothetical protein
MLKMMFGAKTNWPISWVDPLAVAYFCLMFECVPPVDIIIGRNSGHMGTMGKFPLDSFKGGACKKNEPRKREKEQRGGYMTRRTDGPKWGKANLPPTHQQLDQPNQATHRHNLVVCALQ